MERPHVRGCGNIGTSTCLMGRSAFACALFDLGDALPFGPGTDNIKQTVITVERVDLGEPRAAEWVEMTLEIETAAFAY